MIGFIVGSLSQVPGIDNPSGAPYFFISLYWITSATTLCSAIHSLVCAVFVEVFGQGLGLRGPLGSMIVAIEGMVIEQKQILWSFIITVTSFGLQCIGLYWIMMDRSSAIVCTIITGIAMVLWYRYSIRLYNRFSWSQLRVDWNDEEDPDVELDDLDPSVINQLHNKTSKASSKPQSQSQRQRRATAPSESESSPSGDISGLSVQQLHGIDEDQAAAATSGGYLTLKASARFGRDPWKRRYFMVRGISVYYYKDKRAFQSEPAKPINVRPIDLEGYMLIADAREPPYLLSLIPIEEEDIRKAWKFRTDTLAEYSAWIDLFGAALGETPTGRRLGKDQLVTLHGNSSGSQAGQGRREGADDEEGL
jgi:hypothetical protein